jgi:hypothetical protein
MNWPNNLECCITKGWKGFSVENTLAYWVHYEEKKVCENHSWERIINTSF